MAEANTMKLFSRFMSLAILTGLLIVPVSEARTRVFVRIGPPPVVVERQTVAPHAGYVWQPGYHRWNGQTYVWSSGTWARPPYRNARWIPGQWVQERRGHYWVAGHWSR
jgi:WXXGXW repeat (2 copies)